MSAPNNLHIPKVHSNKSFTHKNHTENNEFSKLNQFLKGFSHSIDNLIFCL